MAILTAEASNKNFFIHPKLTRDNIVSFLFIIFIAYILYSRYYYPQEDNYDKETQILIQEAETILSNKDIPETVKIKIIEGMQYQRNEIYPTILKILVPQRGSVGPVTKNSAD